MPARHELRIPVDAGAIEGHLVVPPRTLAMVIFAHGSGSGRFSRRNNFVAERLQARGLATLLMDLLTPEEEARDLATREHRFDIPLLARRLETAMAFLPDRPEAAGLPVGLFGSSTGASAALVAAAWAPEAVGAVVSRGGRTDLAGEALIRVRAATLLIVGGRDQVVLDINRESLERLSQASERRLEVVSAAGHLFEEPGALERVADLAGDWFLLHLSPE